MKLTLAEKKAIETQTKDYIKQGIDKEIAKVMAKALFDTGVLKVVVNYNK